MPMSHEERLALIYKPFPRVRRLPPGYLWSGTIVGDRFYGDGEDYAARLRRVVVDSEPDPAAALWAAGSVPLAAGVLDPDAD